MEKIHVLGKRKNNQVSFKCPYCKKLTPSGRLGKKQVIHRHGCEPNETSVERTPHCIDYQKPPEKQNNNYSFVIHFD